MQQKQAELDQEVEQIRELEAQLKAKETRLLHGGQEIEEALRRKEQLHEMEEAIARQQEKEAQLAQQMDEAEEAQLYLNEQYSSRQEELDNKTQKLRHLWQKFKEKQSDLRDLQDEYEGERLDLLDTIRDLTTQLKLKTLLLSATMTDRHLALIEDKAHWDEFTDEWQLPGFTMAPMSRRQPFPIDDEPTEFSNEAGSPGRQGSASRRSLVSKFIAAGLVPDPDLDDPSSRSKSAGRHRRELQQALRRAGLVPGQDSQDSPYMSYSRDVGAKSRPYAASTTMSSS